MTRSHSSQSGVSTESSPISVGAAMAREADPRIVGEVVRPAFDEDGGAPAPAIAPAPERRGTGWQQLEDSLLGDAIGAALLLVVLAGGMLIALAVLS